MTVTVAYCSLFFFYNLRPFGVYKLPPKNCSYVTDICHQNFFLGANLPLV